MKKRIYAILLAMIMLVSVLPATALAGVESAVRSAQNFTVDGKAVNCEKYNIDGSNYFKLRDLAYLLNGTNNQFAVGYDAGSGTVSIESGKAYTVAGGELVIGEDEARTAVPSAQTILINGKQVTDLSVYNIGGNNYFKLRDLGDYVGFYVDYDAATNTAIVRTDTKKETEQFSDGSVHESIFDAGGNLLVSRYISSDGNTVQEYTFDANGNSLSLKNINYASGVSYVYTYDANGNTLSKKYTSFDGYSRSSFYTYDTDGNLISETTRDSEGWGDSYDYTYDANGNRLSQKYTRHDGYSYTTVYTYDANGRLLTENTNHDSGFAPDENITYTYDADGRLLSRTNIRDDGLTFIETYDADGNRISVEMV